MKIFQLATGLVGRSIVVPLLQLLLVCLLVRLKNLLRDTSPSFLYSLFFFFPLPHSQSILIFNEILAPRRLRDPKFDILSHSKLPC